MHRYRLRGVTPESGFGKSGWWCCHLTEKWGVPVAGKKQVSGAFGTGEQEGKIRSLGLPEVGVRGPVLL